MNIQKVNNQQSFQGVITGTNILKPMHTSEYADGIFKQKADAISDGIRTKGTNHEETKSMLKDFIHFLSAESNTPLKFNVDSFSFVNTKKAITLTNAEETLNLQLLG